ETFFAVTFLTDLFAGTDFFAVAFLTDLFAGEAFFAVTFLIDLFAGADFFAAAFLTDLFAGADFFAVAFLTDLFAVAPELFIFCTEDFSVGVFPNSEDLGWEPDSLTLTCTSGSLSLSGITSRCSAGLEGLSTIFLSRLI